MDKTQRYDHVLKTAKAVIDGYSMDEIGKMAILSSILKSEFKEWVFCGFYRVVKESLLEIGPIKVMYWLVGILILTVVYAASQHGHKQR